MRILARVSIICVAIVDSYVPWDQEDVIGIELCRRRRSELVVAKGQSRLWLEVTRFNESQVLQ